jgi:acetyl esterase/lipase
MKLSKLIGMTAFLAALTISAQQLTLPLWPHGAPEPPQTSAAEVNIATPQEIARAGYPMNRLTNVTMPTLTVFSPQGSTSGARAAALVFPGGGYARLAMDIEGDQTCQWLNSINMVCLLVKYRVPEKGYYPENPADLEDAQQAMRLARAHAAEWHIDPARIGVIGFSAGGNLAVLLSNHPDDAHVLSTPAGADVPLQDGKPIDARANFTIAGYPAYLAAQPSMRELLPQYAPNAFTPPTFIVVAEDDHTYGPNSLVYYRALMDATVPAELHVYSSGGHGFGTFPSSAKPEGYWTDVAATWLRNLHVIPN